MTTYVSRLYKNAIKAENEIIKNYMGSNKPFNWYYGTYKEGKEEYKCVTEGHVLIAFGFDSFALDKAIFETHNKVLSDNAISQMVNEIDATSFESAHMVGMKVVQGAKKYTFCVLKKESTGEEILFNEKYKKYFTDDVEYKVFNAVTPIKVYSGDVFLGVIMPIRPK